jgi:hypothetical protein
VVGNDSVLIQLKKVYSWKTSYHKYPFYLSEADPNRIYSYDDVFIEIFKTGSAPTKRGKGQHGWVKTVFGLDINAEEREVVVNGIGLMDKISKDCYQLSPAAVELGRSYALAPSGHAWRKTFAEIIARNDIRTRVILYYMSILNFGLSTPDGSSSNSLGKSLAAAQLDSVHETIDILSEIPENERTEGQRIYVFNQLLDRYRLEILGPFLSKKITDHGIDLSTGIEYQGAKIIHGRDFRINPEPSINELSSYLAQSLSLFVDLGVLILDPLRNKWVINYSRAHDVFSEKLVLDLFTDKRDDLFEKLLRKYYLNLVDQDGYVSIRSVREAVCNQLDISPGERNSYFNRQVARLISDGRLAVGKTLGWRASAHDALFGDRSMEYVEFLF